MYEKNYELYKLYTCMYAYIHWTVGNMLCITESRYMIENNSEERVSNSEISNKDSAERLSLSTFCSRLAAKLGLGSVIGKGGRGGGEWL